MHTIALCPDMGRAEILQHLTGELTPPVGQEGCCLHIDIEEDCSKPLGCTSRHATVMLQTHHVSKDKTEVNLCKAYAYKGCLRVESWSRS